MNLEPYGLVFLKERLRARGVNPVWYLNNEQADKDEVAQALCSLIATHPDEAAQMLPLVSVFGQLIQPPLVANRRGGTVDFPWEREWRYPVASGPFTFDEYDVFVGLCPADEIDGFEELFPYIAFIDPTRPQTWYATKLVEAHPRVDLKSSVV